MVKTRRGWYLVDIKADEDERKRNEKEVVLEMRRAAMIKRCDAKIARRHLQAEQRETCKKEKLLHAQKLIDLKQREIEVTHRLAAELSLRKSEEVKRALKLNQIKSFARSLPDCATKEARSRLIEKKVNLEASQTKLMQLLHQDETVEKLQQIEQEEKKRNLRVDLQNQLADNHRRIQEEKNKEKEQDRKMIEQTMRKIQEEDARIKEKKNNDVIFLRKEMTASLAAKDAWEKKYKKALEAEDERISRIVAEKEARQEKLLDIKVEFREMREAAIDKVAGKLLDDVCKKREREKISNELYQEEQENKWAKEPAMFASRKQYAIAEFRKEMARRQKAIAECKAKNEAIDAAFARYLTEEREKEAEKQRKHNDARHARKIQYGEKLKETITNNRISYAMNILERQSEICAHDENSNQLKTRVRRPNDRSKNNKSAKKEKINMNIGGCANG